MWYLQEYFLKNGLVLAVHPHRDTVTKGRWNLLIHKDNYKKGLVDVNAVLNDYETLVPDSSDIRATWSIPRAAGNGVVQDGDSSSGEQTYASLSMASLVSVLTQEDYAMPVTITNTSIDLTFREVSVPSSGTSNNPSTIPQPTYAQVAQFTTPPLPIQQSAPEIAAHHEIARLKAENQRLKSIVEATSSAGSLVAPATSVLQSPKLSESTTASTITASVSVEQFNDLSSKYDHILMILKSLQTEKGTPSNRSPMDITTTEKHGQQDASSLAVEPGSKRVDSKQTPNKSHPVADAHMHQSP
jgi:hypothetical protein